MLHDATIGEIGSTWGTAYDNVNKKLYVSAFLKRHSGFADGPGAIYVIDYSSGSASAPTLFIDLDGLTNVGSISTNRNLSTIPSDPNYDYEAFGKIGKMS
ncbi:hypothetical protein [Persicobacter diffluens]|uniref:hypothetical protein n=1 Tax=Persicobacter diffluens TaxID=981 RepID=UPI0030C758BC